METEQKMEQKIQEQVPDQKQKEVRVKIKLIHETSGNEYLYMIIKICAEADILSAVIYNCKGIYVYSIDRPDDVMNKIEGIVTELKNDVITRVRNINETVKKIEEFAAKNGIPLEIE